MKNQENITYTLLNELVGTLDRLSVVYDELVELAKTKHNCLISCDIEELETLIYAERNKAELAQLLEEKRQRIMNIYCEKKGLKIKETSITKLIDTIEEPYSNKLRAQADKLTNSIMQLQKLNDMNMALTHHSLEVTEDIIDIFCPPVFKHSVYQNTGKMKGKEVSRVLIDTKI
ncbi:MAG: flagellar protein FlgN [Candidatus Kuenenia sp.]|nr:flagellar protein FlgN [Candidatus Kuenenia hertensis]